jgi:hypothetical protein
MFALLARRYYQQPAAGRQWRRAGRQAAARDDEPLVRPADGRRPTGRAVDPVDRSLDSPGCAS